MCLKLRSPNFRKMAKNTFCLANYSLVIWEAFKDCRGHLTRRLNKPFEDIENLGTC